MFCQNKPKTMNHTATQAPEYYLKTYFGYESFRPLQREIIGDILQKKDALILMPTGGGKSICYQIPALMLSGITIVVSPLISLMKDQVDSLIANGVPAAFLNSTLSFEEEGEIIRNCMEENIKLLYLAPERLISTFDFLSQNIKIQLIAIDEAHCISGWGHDFRPEYTQLSVLKQKLPHVPIVALTATADKVTRKDILSQLRIPEAKVFIASFNRPNLSLEVRSGWTEKNKSSAILKYIRSKPHESGVIYCLSRKITEKIAAFLQSNGVNASFYHAGMSPGDRSRVQEAFMNDTTPVIVATIAFGMGIDKSNIRWVIHYNLPKNIEGYYQEIGRAGRDGLPSDTILYYNYADLQILTRFATESGQPELNLEKLGRIQQFAESDVCRRKILLNYFAENTTENCGNCDVCKNPPKHFDGTILIQKALSAVMRTQEKVGVNLLIDILRGSQKQEIIEKNYHKIKTFGSGVGISAFDWKHYILQMLNLGVIEMAYDENFSLKVTELGKKILFGTSTMEMVIPKDYEEIRKKSTKEKAFEKEAFIPAVVTLEERLFDNLRLVRKKLAQDQNVPPYIIFHDTSLKEMAAYLPVSMQELRQIYGVSLTKSEKYGYEMLAEITRFIHENQIIRKKEVFISKPQIVSAPQNTHKTPTHEVTFILFKEGLSIEAIAEKRMLNISTIHTHLQTCYLHHLIEDHTPYISEEEINLVANAARVVGSPEKIKSIYEFLEDKVEYLVIRWAIAVLKKNDRLSP